MVKTAEHSNHHGFWVEIFHGSVRSVKRRVFNSIISWLVVINIAAIMWQTTPLSKMADHRLHILNVCITIIFALEYALRLVTFPANKWRFLFSAVSIIDIISIYPVLFSYFIPGLNWNFLTVLRLFRISKFFGHIRSMRLVVRVIKRIYPVLLLSCLLLAILIVVSSFLLYIAEHAAQPHKFSSIVSALWWAVNTITGVGYGDVVPITVMGKFIAGAISIIGVFTVAVPTGIISAGFITEFKQFREMLDHERQMRKQRRKK